MQGTTPSSILWTMLTTDRLLQENKELVDLVAKHTLPLQLCNGTLSDDVLYIYSAQDQKFFITSLRLIALYTSKAPTEKALLRLCKQIGFLMDQENDYFGNCMKLTEREPLKQYVHKTLPKVQNYLDFLNDMPSSRNYQQWVTHMWCAEYVYWRWAHDLPRAENLEWKHQEWIRLHDGDHFEEWCQFLASEVNKYSYEEVSGIFKETLKLEKDFFDACEEAAKATK